MRCPGRYTTFVRAEDFLREKLGFGCDLVELDRYLQLSGLYRAWCKNPRAQINVEVRHQFEKRPGEATRRRLLGETAEA